MLLMGFLDITNTNSVNKAHAMMDSMKKVILSIVLLFVLATRLLALCPSCGCYLLPKTNALMRRTNWGRLLPIRRWNITSRHRKQAMNIPAPHSH